MSSLHTLNQIPAEKMRALVTSTGAYIGSPAHLLPELPSAATEFAVKYVRDYALEPWMVEHVARIWMAGRCAR